MQIAESASGITVENEKFIAVFDSLGRLCSYYDKGEEREIDAQGILLMDVLELAGVETVPENGVSVTAADEYSVEVTADELAEAGKVFLLEEDAPRLIVFGDNGEKRNVKNVARITVW